MSNNSATNNQTYDRLQAEATTWKLWKEIKRFDDLEEKILGLACYSSDSYGTWEEALSQGGVYEFNLENNTVYECLNAMGDARVAGRCLGLSDSLEFIARPDNGWLWSENPSRKYYEGRKFRLAVVSEVGAVDVYPETFSGESLLDLLPIAPEAKGKYRILEVFEEPAKELGQGVESTAKQRYVEAYNLLCVQASTENNDLDFGLLFVALDRSTAAMADLLKLVYGEEVAV